MTLKLALASALINASWACAAGEYELSMRAMERGHKIVSSADVLHRRYADVVTGSLLHNGAMSSQLFRRQAAGAGNNDTAGPLQFESTVQLNPDGTINMDSWDVETEAACQSALRQLPTASNPSGTCICYNLPSLDTTTGVFEADLRVYKLNEPSGDFAGIPPQNVMVGLMYNGASVSPVEQEGIPDGEVTKRQDDPAAAVPAPADGNPAADGDADADDAAAGSEGTAAEDGANANDALPLLQHYLFVGQIDDSRMSSDMNMAQFEALVMPVLTLTAIDSSGGTVSTNVSSNEAVFVTGVFSQEVVMSEFSLASAAVEFTAEQLKEKNVAFVLPGLRLMVYPIGLIITSVWLVLGLTAYGIGTYDRMRYAQSYRRRMAMANSSAYKRI